MDKHNNQDEAFEPLLQEISAAEATLRSHFEDTPLPAPEILARIKRQLRVEARPVRRTWPLWAGAMAAAILLAAGAGLYYQSQAGPATREDSDTPQPPHVLADGGDASLDAFMASVPAALSDEDPAMQQLNSDLKELESQTSRSWSDANPPLQPSAERQVGGRWTVGALANSHTSAWSRDVVGLQCASSLENRSNG